MKNKFLLSLFVYMFCFCGLIKTSELTFAGSAFAFACITWSKVLFYNPVDKEINGLLMENDELFGDINNRLRKASVIEKIKQQRRATRPAGPHVGPPAVATRPSIGAIRTIAFAPEVVQMRRGEPQQLPSEQSEVKQSETEQPSGDTVDAVAE